MLQGIETRAEGATEPTWTETIEIGLWFVALIPGLAAGLLFVFRQGWQRPLVVALAAVVALFVLTFVQPDLWQRGLLDAGLFAAVVWAWLEPASPPSLKINRVSPIVYH